MTHSKSLEREITNYQFSSLLSEENTADFENTDVFSYSSWWVQLTLPVLYSQPGFPGAVPSQWHGFAPKMADRKVLFLSTMCSLVIQFLTQQYKTFINQSKLQRGPSRWSRLEHWPCEERLEDQADFGLKKLREEKEKGQVLLVCITSWEFHKVF